LQVHCLFAGTLFIPRQFTVKFAMERRMGEEKRIVLLVTVKGGPIP
jgi:hypothetical protein